MPIEETVNQKALAIANLSDIGIKGRGDNPRNATAILYLHQDSYFEELIALETLGVNKVTLIDPLTGKCPDEMKDIAPRDTVVHINRAKESEGGKPIESIQIMLDINEVTKLKASGFQHPVFDALLGQGRSHSRRSR
jgi:hypothetical protein